MYPQGLDRGNLALCHKSMPPAPSPMHMKRTATFAPRNNADGTQSSMRASLPPIAPVRTSVATDSISPASSSSGPSTCSHSRHSTPPALSPSSRSSSLNASLHDVGSLGLHLGTVDTFPSVDAADHIPTRTSLVNTLLAFRRQQSWNAEKIKDINHHSFFDDKNFKHVATHASTLPFHGATYNSHQRNDSSGRSAHHFSVAGLPNRMLLKGDDVDLSSISSTVHSQNHHTAVPTHNEPPPYTEKIPRLLTDSNLEATLSSWNHAATPFSPRRIHSTSYIRSSLEGVNSCVVPRASRQKLNMLSEPNVSVTMAPHSLETLSNPGKKCSGSPSPSDAPLPVNSVGWTSQWTHDHNKSAIPATVSNVGISSLLSGGPAAGCPPLVAGATSLFTSSPSLTIPVSDSHDTYASLISSSPPSTSTTSTASTHDLGLCRSSPLSGHDMLGAVTNLEHQCKHRKESLYKTELCRGFEEKGHCDYGVKCQFAHGKHELRNIQRHPKWKTELCRTFWRYGTCPYAKRCCFIHEAKEASGVSDADTPTSKAPLFARIKATQVAGALTDLGRATEDLDQASPGRIITGYYNHSSREEASPSNRSEDAKARNSRIRAAFEYDPFGDLEGRNTFGVFGSLRSTASGNGDSLATRV